MNSALLNRFSPVAFVFCAVSAFGQVTGSDGVEFQVVPVGVEDQCNRIVLQGTGRFQGIAWLAPQVYVSVNRNLERLFEVIPAEQPGQSIVRLGLYFPFADEGLESRRDRSLLIEHGCPMEGLIPRINAVLPEEDRIARISSLPVRFIDVRIDGVEGSYRIGTESTSVLRYQGADHVVEFQVPNSRIPSILERIRGRVGLGVHLTLHFRARARDGSIQVSFDVQDFTAKMRRELRGQVEVTQAELEAAVAIAIRNTRLTAQIEASESSAFEQMTSSIMTQLLGQLGQPQAPTVPPRSGRPNPTAPAAPASAPVAGGTSGGAGRPPVAAESTTPSAPAAASPAAGVFAVSAVLEATATLSSTEISIERMSTQREGVYAVSANLMGDIDDPGVLSPYLISGRDPISVGRLDAGQSLVITGMDWIEEAPVYTTSTTYLSREGLEEHNARASFRTANPNFIAMFEGQTNEGPVAFRPWTPECLWVGFRLGGPGGAVSTCSGIQFFGLEIDSVSTFRPVSETELRFGSLSSELQNLEVRFDHLGRSFRLSELISVDRSELKAELNESSGRLIITAKAPLGRVRLANRAEAPVTTIPTERLFSVGGFLHPKWGETTPRFFEAKALSYQRGPRRTTRRYRARVRVQSAELGIIRINTPPADVAPVIEALPSQR